MLLSVEVKMMKEIWNDLFFVKDSVDFKCFEDKLKRNVSCNCI